MIRIDQGNSYVYILSLGRILEIFSGINPLIPYYHVVSNENLPHIIHLHRYKNITLFLKDVDFFGRRFNPISLEDLLDYVYKGKKLKKNSLILTFDDGYAECFHIVAPILIRKGIPAIFFVCSDFVDNRVLGYKNKASIIIDYLIKNESVVLPEPLDFVNCSLQDKINFILSISYKDRGILDRIAEKNGLSWDEYLFKNRPYMSSEQLQTLKKAGFYIGAHSKDHARYEELSVDEQINQTSQSISYLRKAFNLEYSLFAFPFSDQGVSLEFFKRAKRIVDISFGTHGALLDQVSWNLQRINFERSLESADFIYYKKILRRVINRVRMNHIIERKA